MDHVYKQTVEYEQWSCVCDDGMIEKLGKKVCLCVKRTLGFYMLDDDDDDYDDVSAVDDDNDKRTGTINCY